MRQLSAAANDVPWAIHCHDSPLCNGIKAVQSDGAAMLRLSLLLQCQMDLLEVSRSEGWSRSKSSPHSRWCGRSSAQAPPLLSSHHEDMGWLRPPSLCFPTHSLCGNKGEDLTFGTTAQAEILPSWQSPEQQDPSPGSCLPPATLLSLMPGPHSTETKPHALPFQPNPKPCSVPFVCHYKQLLKHGLKWTLCGIHD